MPFKIVFLNRSFYPDITATSQLLTELSEDLVKDCHYQVTVISGRPLIAQGDYQANGFGLKIMRKEYFRGIEIIRVRNTTFSTDSFLGRVSNYLSYFCLSFFAAFCLKKPDLVITLTDPPIIGLVGLTVSRRFHIPLVISVRDIFPEAARGLDNYRNKILDFLLDGINRYCLSLADEVVSLGAAMRKKLIAEKHLDPKKISIIPDWADCRQIVPGPKRNPFSEAHKITEHFVVMYSGNIGASSGLETLVRSARILKTHRDILFVIIGEGIIKNRLKEMAEGYNLENIKFLPYQPKETLPYSLSSADIFVIPLKKGLAGYSAPSKIYSILASGRPYVACIEAMSEIAMMAEEFNCGIICGPEDPWDLAEKILFFHNNDTLRLKMGEDARKAALNFDRNRGVKSYYELCEKLLNAKKNI